MSDDNLPEPFSKRLAVRDKQNALGYLGSNTHTVPGHFTVFWPESGGGYSTELLELTEVTRAAADWLAGFLSGNEPEGWCDIAPRDLASDDPRLFQWHDALNLFRRTGRWSTGRRCEVCGEDVLPSRIRPLCEQHAPDVEDVWADIAIV
jgi:hypothetical protein